MCRLVTGVAVGLAALSTLSVADPLPPRIGVLIPPVKASPLEQGLREGLQELGYVEGKDIVIELRRSTSGSEEELRSLATDLAASNVDLIVASGSLAARVAARNTKLPVVFAPAGDPVETGLAASLAKPEGNATGLSVMATELISKRVQFLREIAPHVRRLVYLGNSSSPFGVRAVEAAKKAAQTVGLKLMTVDARSTAELDVALRAIRKSGADGVVVAGDLLFLANKTKITEAIRNANLPAIYPLKEYHDDGALISYGPNLKEAMRRAVVYVDRILKGAKPSELPIEQISRFELIISMRAARALKLKVPPELLLRADEVIQ